MKKTSQNIEVNQLSMKPNKIVHISNVVFPYS